MRKRSASTATGRSLDVGFALNPSRNVPITCYLDKPSNRKRKLNQYVKSDRIGKGRHGEVFIATNTLNEHREVAIKIVKRSNPKDKIKLLRRNYQQTDGSTKQALNSTENSVRREIAVMKQLRHPNLAALLEVIDDPREDRIYIIMEYISGGPVSWTHPEEHTPLLNLAQTRRIMRDVILGLEYMHSKGILHRDIKPSNIVYTADRSSVKLIDFGISHIMLPPAPRKEKDDLIDPELRALFTPADLTKRIGTPSFLAPEVVWFSDESDSQNGTSSESCNGGPSSTKLKTFPMPKVRPPITPAIDIWSLGVTLYCLVFGKTPFSGTTEDNGHPNEFVLYHQICTQDWDVEEAMGVERIPVSGRYSYINDEASEATPVLQILEAMLRKDPKDRVSLFELKRNPYVLQDITDPKDWLRCTTPLVSSGDNWVKSAARKLVNVLSQKGRLP